MRPLAPDGQHPAGGEPAEGGPQHLGAVEGGVLGVDEEVRPVVDIEEDRVPWSGRAGELRPGPRRQRLRSRLHRSPAALVPAARAQPHLVPRGPSGVPTPSAPSRRPASHRRTRGSRARRPSRGVRPSCAQPTSASSSSTTSTVAARSARTASAVKPRTETTDQHPGSRPGEGGQGPFGPCLGAVHGEGTVHDQLVDGLVADHPAAQHHLAARSGPAREGQRWLVHAGSMPR